MFDRKKYKKYAKLQLKNRWKIPVFMTLICSIIIILLEAPDFKEFYEDYIRLMDSSIAQISNNSSFYSQLRMMISMLIEYVILFAQLHVYIKISRSPAPIYFQDFIDGFNLWSRGILAGLWESLWTFLWSLLFIIPGIVKHYAYSQTKFLVTEYQDLSITKAMKVSITITHGHKADLFIMDLSFIGWLLLCALSCGIGIFWYVPYKTMTMTNAYHSLLKDAISLGIITSEDLVG
ncbi:MAG: DUF975 family protein [Treponema sp.]|nr:DUF975 family protein [Treponema sp.]